MRFSSFLTLGALVAPGLAAMSATEVMANIESLAAQTTALEKQVDGLGFADGLFGIIGLGGVADATAKLNVIIDLCVTTSLAIEGLGDGLDVDTLMIQITALFDANTSIFGTLQGRYGLLSGLGLFGSSFSRAVGKMQDAYGSLYTGLIASLHLGASTDVVVNAIGRLESQSSQLHVAIEVVVNLIGGIFRKN